MAKVLFVRSNFDLATWYLSSYGQKLVDYAKDQGHTIDQLIDDQATFQNFEAAMARNPDMVMIMGHGNENVVTGQDLEPLITLNINDDVMSGKAAFLWACSTGVNLGPSMVEKTCQQFYGYQADFTFLYNPNYESDPLNDPWAQAFFESALATGYGLLLDANGDGQQDLTPAEIYEKTIERYNYYWDWWIKQNENVTDDILTWLNWDRNNFIAITPSGLYKEKAAVAKASLVLPAALGGAALLFLLSRNKETKVL
jgi:hypothetical protein